MVQQDPRNFVYSSDYPMAYFVFDKVFTIQVPASSGGSTGTKTITVPHNLGFEVLPVGYWSVDQDFRSTNDICMDTLGSNLKGVDVIADKTNFYVTGSNSSTSAATLYVHLWAYMSPDANGDAPMVSDSTNYYFNTDYPYLEIVSAGVVRPSSSVNPVEIYHNLGYTPYCRIWKEANYNGHQGIMPYSEDLYDYGVSAETVLVDDEKLHFDKAHSLYRRFYHIYTSEVQQP